MPIAALPREQAASGLGRSAIPEFSSPSRRVLDATAGWQGIRPPTRGLRKPLRPRCGHDHRLCATQPI